jgi:hypothetical protein
VTKQDHRRNPFLGLAAYTSTVPGLDDVTGEGIAACSSHK